MRYILIILFLHSYICAAKEHSPIPPNLNSAYTLITTPTQKISATLTWKVTAPNLKATQWYLISPSPPNHPAQSSPTHTSDRKTQIAKTNDALKQAHVTSKFRATENDITGTSWSVTYNAQLYSRKLILKNSPTQNPPLLSATERSLWLAASTACDYHHKEIVRWIASNNYSRNTDEGEIDYARRIFLTLRASLSYEYLGEQDRRAQSVLTTKKSDCGGMANLYVAILRSQGIPARTLVGRWAKSSKVGELCNKTPYFQQHVKAEFFAQGIGWIPADLSSAVLHDTKPPHLTYFANDPGDFLIFHYESDLSVDSQWFGETKVAYLQHILCWATGKGNFDNQSLEQNWQVTKK